MTLLFVDRTLDTDSYSHRPTQDRTRRRIQCVFSDLEALVAHSPVIPYYTCGACLVAILESCERTLNVVCDRLQSLGRSLLLQVMRVGFDTCHICASQLTEIGLCFL